MKILIAIKNLFAVFFMFFLFFKKGFQQLLFESNCKFDHVGRFRFRPQASRRLSGASAD